MGCCIELNDTLQITKEQGFPVDILDLDRHSRGEVDIESLKGKVFEFNAKKSARVYKISPVRNFLVENRGGKWIYWGHVEVIEQTIYKGEGDEMYTKGRYRILKIYDHQYQILCTKNEARVGKSYFG